MNLALARFVDFTRAWNWSERTIESYEQNIRCFFDWLHAETDVTTLAEVSSETVASWQMALVTTTKKNGEPLSIATQHHRLTALKSFFRFLAREGQLLTSPAASIQLPKKSRPLPQALVTAKETIRIIEAIDTSTPLGLRNRAIVEVLYASGIRNAELRSLTIADFDAAGGTLMIRRGKGKKDRVVPLGPIVTEIVGDYLAKARPKLAQRDGVHALFLTKNGRALGVHAVDYIVKKATEAAGITKPVRPHRLRHACATHMLQRGADIRHIQKLLGHASLGTTQIYTKVEIADLKAVHRKFHPRERGRS
jgi:integrase/recombinase XerD